MAGMIIPTIPVLPAGYMVQPVDMQNLAYAAQFALTKPMTKVIDNTGGVAITTGFLAVGFTTEIFDIDNMWIAGSPKRLTVQTPGWYNFRYGINIGTVAGTYNSCMTSTTGANNPLGAGVVSANFWGGYCDSVSGLPGWVTGGGDWPFYLYAADFVQVFIQAASAGGSTGVTSPAGSASGGSYFSAELVSI
jgi:hypothetical protein